MLIQELCSDIQNLSDQILKHHRGVPFLMAMAWVLMSVVILAVANVSGWPILVATYVAALPWIAILAIASSPAIKIRHVAAFTLLYPLTITAAALMAILRDDSDAYTSRSRRR